MRAAAKDTWVLALIIGATGAIAIMLHLNGQTTCLEVVGFVTGALCVWLTVKESVWNFPISLANVVAFAFVFFKARLFADAGLQIVYFILTLHGWYWWLFGGERGTRLRISRVPQREAALVILTGMIIAIGLTVYLRSIGGAAPVWDATTTALSLCAQYLLNRKYLENWFCWIAADMIYIPLYGYKDLWLTSLLYAIFLGMAGMGLVRWWKSYRAARAAMVPEVALA